MRIRIGVERVDGGNCNTCFCGGRADLSQRVCAKPAENIYFSQWQQIAE